MTIRVHSAAPEGLLYALLAFGPFAFGCVEPWSAATLEILAFLLALACFLRGRAVAPRAGRRAWAAPAAVAVLGLIQILGAAPADGPRPLGPFTAAPHATAAAVLLWTAYACVVYAVPRVIATPRAARRFCWVLFGLGAAVAAHGVIQSLLTRDSIYGFRPTLHDVIPFAAYYNRDHAANLLLMCLGPGLGLAFARAARWNPTDGPLPGEVQTQAWLAAALAAVFGAVLYTHSRGALLALPLTAGVMAAAGAGFAERTWERRAVLALAVGGLALAGFFAFAHVSSLELYGARLDSSVSTRLLIYQACARWLQDSPLFGTGLGTFSAVFPSYQDHSVGAFVAHAHSDWLESALETGAAGFALMLAAAVWAGAAFVRIWLGARSREMRALIGGALAAVVAFTAHGLFEFAFRIPANAVVFFALAGFLLSAPAWADKLPSAPRSVPPEPSSAAGALAAFAVLAGAAALPAAAAWAAFGKTTPAERAAGWAVSLERDPSPLAARELARALSELAARTTPADPELSRAALGYSLKAAAARPFDGEALGVAATTLARLGRGGDADEMRQRERRVRPEAR